MAGAVVVAGMTVSVNAEPPRYRVEVVGTFYQPGQTWRYSSPRGINYRGDLVGSSAMGTRMVPFVYGDGGLTELPFPAPDVNGEASAINDAGVIVGQTYLSTRAMRWSDGGVMDLGTLGGSWAVAQSVNNSGLIVGSSGLAGDVRAAGFVWRDGLMTALPTPAAMTDAAAMGLSDTGFIVGFARNGDEPARAVRWRDGISEVLPSLNAGAHAYAKAVNDAGHAVGLEQDDTRSRALLWRDGVVIDLGFFGAAYTEARDINNLGQIVGVSDDFSDSEPFLWEDGVMYRLQQLLAPEFASVDLITASAINDRGQIAADAFIDGWQTAVLLTPIPAPGALVLLGLAAARRRRW